MIAGLSILIYVFVRRIENPVSIDRYVYIGSHYGSGSPQAFFSLYGIRRAKRKIDTLTGSIPAAYQKNRKLQGRTTSGFLPIFFWIAAMASFCAVCRFLMIWVVPSVLVYAFFHFLMCMLTVLLTGAFVGNRPLKGWKIAHKMGKGEI